MQVDGITDTLQRLDTTPAPRLPDAPTAIKSAIATLKQLEEAHTYTARRALILTARKHLGVCVMADELDLLQACVCACVVMCVLMCLCLCACVDTFVCIYT